MFSLKSVSPSIGQSFGVKHKHPKIVDEAALMATKLESYLNPCKSIWPLICCPFHREASSATTGTRSDEDEDTATSIASVQARTIPRRTR